MKQVLLAAIIGTSTLLASGTAAAQAKPEDVIKFRKAAMVVKAWEMRAMGAMVKGQMPYDQAIFAKNAQTIALIAQGEPEAYAAGSDKGAETRVKPEVWSDAAGFKKTIETYQADATKLAEVAKTATTVDQVRGPFSALAKNCAACHDAYRSK